MSCPFQPGDFCPLLVAAHDGEAVAYGCDDGQLGQGGCAVDRGLNHTIAVSELRARFPRLVAECEFLQNAKERKAQRLRNFRAAGIH